MVAIHLSLSLGINFCLMVCQIFQSHYCFHPQLGVDEVVGSNGSSSLLFMLNVNSNILLATLKRLWQFMLHKRKLKSNELTSRSLLQLEWKYYKLFCISYNNSSKNQHPSQPAKTSFNLVDFLWYKCITIILALKIKIPKLVIGRI